MAHVAILKAHHKAYRRGSDPRAATCRSKLQTKRAKLNQEINKELRLRAGAENLFRATSNKKLRETVSLELSFVNSNLQLLKEQLAVLNSSVEVYQAPQLSDAHIPMIPLGLKETKEVLFLPSLQEFVVEHYRETGSEYDEAIAELSDMRQAMRTPSRDATGVALLYEYYNQLYYFERRFFSPERGLGIYFEWFDSLTGVPSAQRTVAFEKACVLFNLGALYTQIGARQERYTGDGLDASVDNFLRAASIFRFIVDNFTNAPSMDLAPQVLEALILLMITQARECLFEKLLLTSSGGDRTAESCVKLGNVIDVNQDIDAYLEQAQEAAELSESYQRVYEAMSIDLVKDYVPPPWIGLVQVKSQYYKGAAHQLVGRGLYHHQGELGLETQETLGFLYADTTKSNVKISTIIDIRVPKDDVERQQLGQSHLREAVLVHEESMRLQRMCRELKKRDHLSSFLRAAHEAALTAYTLAQGEDDFGEALDPPPILASTKLQLSFGQPDFGVHPVTDLFKKLGPLTLFSAKLKWYPARDASLRKLHDQGFGFSVRGDGPIIIAGVDGASIADLAGVREGDVIVGIDDVDVKWSSHEEVVSMIKAAKNVLKLRLMQPVERPTHLTKSLKSVGKAVNAQGRGSTSPTSTTSSSSGVSSAASNLSSSLASSKSCDRIHALGHHRNHQPRRRDKSLDSHVKYRTDSKSSTKGGTGAEKGRFSMASDFFNLSLTTARERERSVAEAKYRTSITGGKPTWNPFRRTDKSRERDPPKHQSPSADDTYYRNIILR